MTSDMAIPSSRDPNGPVCPLAQGRLGAAPPNCPRTAFDAVVIDSSKVLAPQHANSRRGGAEVFASEGPTRALGNPAEIPREGLGRVLLVRQVPAQPLCHECRNERR
jgi:hypothetical protein